MKNDLWDYRELRQLHGAQVDLDVVKTLAWKVPDLQLRHGGGELGSERRTSAAEYVEVIDSGALKHMLQLRHCDLLQRFQRSTVVDRVPIVDDMIVAPAVQPFAGQRRR